MTRRALGFALFDARMWLRSSDFWVEVMVEADQLQQEHGAKALELAARRLDEGAQCNRVFARAVLTELEKRAARKRSATGEDPSFA